MYVSVNTQLNRSNQATCTKRRNTQENLVCHHAKRMLYKCLFQKHFSTTIKLCVRSPWDTNTKGLLAAQTEAAAGPSISSIKDISSSTPRQPDDLGKNHHANICAFFRAKQQSQKQQIQDKQKSFLGYPYLLPFDRSKRYSMWQGLVHFLYLQTSLNIIQKFKYINRMLFWTFCHEHFTGTW